MEKKLNDRGYFIDGITFRLEETKNGSICASMVFNLHDLISSVKDRGYLAGTLAIYAIPYKDINSSGITHYCILDREPPFLEGKQGSDGTSRDITMNVDPNFNEEDYLEDKKPKNPLGL